MKSPIALAIVLAGAAAFSASLPAAPTGTPPPGTPAPAPAPSSVLLRVDQYNKSDMNPKDKKAYTNIHTRTVNAIITNNSGEPIDVKVKRIVFGRSLFEHHLVTVAEGETAATIKPHETQKIPTAQATATAVEQHWDAKAKKMIDATGANIVGIGVQVLQGNTLVAEFYDPPSLKEQWGKTQPLPGATAPAAKPAAKPTATPAKS
ncbi:MAG: hypothetical protein P4L99_06215 [Chthoniobacter sp.]|nr:hypothetical protein [Chthoniobacter sp.]